MHEMHQLQPFFPVLEGALFQYTHSYSERAIPENVYKQLLNVKILTNTSIII